MTLDHLAVGPLKGGGLWAAGQVFMNDAPSPT